jgi:hypothetical protein
MWPTTFQEQFCQRVGCLPDAYGRKVFWRCLHRRSLPLAALIHLLNRNFFELDFATIRQLGLARSFAEYRAEVDSFRYECGMRGGFLRRTLRVRVSGGRLMALLLSVRPDEKRSRRPSSESSL